MLTYSNECTICTTYAESFAFHYAHLKNIHFLANKGVTAIFRDSEQETYLFRPSGIHNTIES